MMNSVNELSKSLFTNVLWSFAGRFGYLSVGLISNVILVRLLSPKEFGQLGIVMFFVVVASVLIESGLSGALIRKKNATEIDYSTIFIFNIVVSLFLMTLMIFSSVGIANFYNDPELKNILIVSSLVLLINSLRIIQVTRLIKGLRFKEKAFYDFIAISISSVVAVLLAYNGAGIWSLITLQLLTSSIITALLWIFVGPLHSYKFSFNSFKMFYKFGINTTLSSLLNTAFDNVYQLVLAKYFSISQAGYFYQAKKLEEMPSGILYTTIHGVVYSALAKIKDEPNEFNPLYQNIVRIFTIIIALMCVLIYFYSEILVVFLYGDDWISSVFYLQLLVIASFFYLQENFNRVIFKVFDKTNKILQLEVLKKIIQSCTIAYGLWTMSIENLLYGFILTSIISFFINYYFSKNIQNDFNLKDLFIIIKVFIVAVATIVISSIITNIFNIEGFQTLLLLPVLLLLYALMLHFVRASNLHDDIKRIRAFIK